MLILYLILLIVHFIIKDRFHSISVVYYACPLPLIILFGLLITLLFFKRKLVFYFLSIVFLGTSIYFFSHYFGSEFEQNPSDKTSYILFWNAAKNQPLPTDILIKHIKAYNPEIMAIVEAVEVSDKDMNILNVACPEYQFQRLEGEMIIGVKGRIQHIKFKSESDVYKFNYVTVVVDLKPMSILIADVYSGPLLNKQVPLNIIKNESQSYNADMIVGDFNTPYESVFFKDFKTDYYSFHPYSIGMTSTWPVPIPVIEIDQIWIKKSFQPIKMEKFCYEVSDHKLLIAEYK